MAQKIPLNKFKSLYTPITGFEDYQFVYTAQTDRATILLNCQVANSASTDLTVSLYVSGGRELQETPERGFFPVVENLPVPPNDARSLVTGRLVLRGKDGSFFWPDSLYIKASNPGLTLSLGLLEAVNKD